MTISNRPPHLKALSDDREDYRRVFQKHVFQLVKWGYDRLDALQYRHSEEEEISGDLGEKINEILQDRSFPSWDGIPCM